MRRLIASSGVGDLLGDAFHHDELGRERGMAPDRERDPGIAAEPVQTGMVERDRDEEGLAVPVEPDRHHERRTVLAQAGEVHDVLLGEERVELVGRHRERRRTSPRVT